MKQPKIFGHGPYVGTTGYNNHTRDFFRGISKHFPLKFRNFTVGSGWLRERSIWRMNTIVCEMAWFFGTLSTYRGLTRCIVHSHQTSQGGCDDFL